MAHFWKYLKYIQHIYLFIVIGYWKMICSWKFIALISNSRMQTRNISFWSEYCILYYNSEVSDWYHSLKIECRYFWETEYLSKPIVNYLCGYFVTWRPGDFWNIFLTKLCCKKNFIWKVFHSLHIRMQFWRTVMTWMPLYRQGREIFPKRIMLVHW